MCFRCKERPALHQWNSCANGNYWLPLCTACDIALNRWVLDFMRFPKELETELIREYVQKLKLKEAT